MIVTSLSVLRRDSEYTCNISSENTQIFNFCELVFFFFFHPKESAYRKNLPYMRNQNFSKLNITSYISNLEEFSYYWYYCLLDNVMGSLYIRRYKAFKKKKKAYGQRIKENENLNRILLWFG